MRNTYRLDISDNTIRMVVNYIGKAVFEEECRQAEAAFEKFDSGKADFKNSKKGVLYIEAYRAALNTQYKNDEGSTWCENKLGVVYLSGHIIYSLSDSNPIVFAS